MIQIADTSNIANLLSRMGQERRSLEREEMQQQEQRLSQQEALYTSQLLRSNPQDRGAIIQQGYAEGVFDDEDLEAFATVDPYEMEGLIVDKLRIDGYGELLPSQYQQGGKFGRLQAAVDADGNPVFIQSSGTGQIRQAKGFTPITTAQKESQKTDELVRREKLLKDSQNKLQLQEIDLLKKRLDLTQSERMQGAKDREVESQIDLGNSIISGDLDAIFGRGEEFYPDLLRSQSGIDLKADVNQFVGQLKLAAAGKMKGQGSVSDSERKTLNEAATVLSNPNISPERARKAMEDAVDAIIMTTSGGDKTPRSTGGQSGRAKRKDSNVVKWGDLP
ncbi:MAG: hypothetical protein GY727_00610 [Gammaproteobacteria bacterium]|nr:hypothetical protein [Gammaproteobacteria bacterium]MCP4972825.1 hypothetical protein [Prochlorococcus sp.]